MSNLFKSYFCKNGKRILLMTGLHDKDKTNCMQKNTYKEKVLKLLVDNRQKNNCDNF